MKSGGYVRMDKNKTASIGNIVAILASGASGSKSKVISKRESFYSRTSSKKLAERLEGGKKTNKRAKKSNSKRR